MDEFGHIELSKDQFRELLLAVIVGMHLRRHAAELKEEDIAAAEEMEHHLLSLAKDLGAEDFVDRGRDGLVPSRLAEDLCHAILDEHNNEEFWKRLETELAERDFLKTLKKGEKAIVESTGIFPKGVEKYYAKYRKEFDDNGTDNLFLSP